MATSTDVLKQLSEVVATVPDTDISVRVAYLDANQANIMAKGSLISWNTAIASAIAIKCKVKVVDLYKHNGNKLTLRFYDDGNQINNEISIIVRNNEVNESVEIKFIPFIKTINIQFKDRNPKRLPAHFHKGITKVLQPYTHTTKDIFLDKGKSIFINRIYMLKELPFEINDLSNQYKVDHDFTWSFVSPFDMVRVAEANNIKCSVTNAFANYLLGKASEKSKRRILSQLEQINDGPIANVSDTSAPSQQENTKTEKVSNTKATATAMSNDNLDSGHPTKEESSNLSTKKIKPSAKPTSPKKKGGIQPSDMPQQMLVNEDKCRTCKNGSSMISLADIISKIENISESDIKQQMTKANKLTPVQYKTGCIKAVKLMVTQKITQYHTLKGTVYIRCMHDISKFVEKTFTSTGRKPQFKLSNIESLNLYDN